VPPRKRGSGGGGGGGQTVTATIPAGADPYGVAVSPTGPEAGDLYVTNTISHGNGTVSVINPATNTVTATIPVGAFPSGVAVSPTGSQAGDVYVANYDSGTVSVIS
jgi:YVTN family beta-propeller protein